ncbi:MAG: hypothetical protein ACMUIG_01815 [Thermoplasmatota archaeon]
MKKLWFLFAFLFILPPGSAHPLSDYSYRLEDPSEDVTYFDYEMFEIFIGKQIPDIDVTSIDVIGTNDSLIFKLKVKGKINTGSEYSYHIYGIFEHPLHYGNRFVIDFNEGYTSLTCQWNGTVYNLTDSTEVSGNTLKIIAPMGSMPEDDLTDIQFMAGKYDMDGGVLYEDSSIPFEEYARRDLRFFYTIIALILLGGAVALLIFVKWKKIKNTYYNVALKKCPHCGVRYKRRTKSCVYCKKSL